MSELSPPLFHFSLHISSQIEHFCLLYSCIHKSLQRNLELSFLTVLILVLFSIIAPGAESSFSIPVRRGYMLALCTHTLFLLISHTCQLLYQIYLSLFLLLSFVSSISPISLVFFSKSVTATSNLLNLILLFCVCCSIL